MINEIRHYAGKAAGYVESGAKTVGKYVGVTILTGIVALMADDATATTLESQPAPDKPTSGKVGLEQRVVDNLPNPSRNYSNQLSGETYIGLYTDINRSNSCATYPIPFCELEMWIWCLPDQRGMPGADFMISYPENVLRIHTETNPAIGREMGSLSSGIKVWFSGCQYDWQWTHHEQLCVLGVNPSIIEVLEAHIWFCGPEFEIPGSAIVLNNLYIYDCESTATEKSTWGAIKGQFNK